VGRIQKEQFELPDDMKVFAADTSKRAVHMMKRLFLNM
jgi:hypothetical protein